MADDGVEFDGSTPERQPLGGAEAAFLALAEALAARGHEVRVANNCPAPLARNRVAWTPIAEGVPEECDLYIGNRGHRLIGLAPKARARVFWLHNPGDYHASTVPGWVPSGGRAVIPYGLDAVYRAATARADTPPPIAVFTSNPLRGLDWLLDLWVARIRPALPAAELHLYCGPAVYGGGKAQPMAAVLARADALAGAGVRRFAPVPRAALIAALEAARAMLYRGDAGETFCLALAEAQAVGVPAVVQPLGAVVERVEDGVTGTIARDDDAFTRAALALLGDDALWTRQHQAALARQKGVSWDDVAQRFEALLP